MRRVMARRNGWLVLGASVIMVGLLAQHAPNAQEFEPKVGQQGKDVVWVPTPEVLVDQMLDMAQVTAADFVMDLGSGDGRTVIAAAKRGATAVGIEYNPEMVELSRRNAAQEGVSDKVTFQNADLFETDLSGADVITMFLLPSINLKLRPTILDLEPGTRIVSNTFTMDDWDPDETFRVEDCTSWCTAFLWIVPAQVEGIWQLPNGSLVLEQQFQTLSGSLTMNNATAIVVDAKMNGDEIAFSSGGVEYTGRVTGDTITGTTSAGGNWSAKRM